MRHGGGGGSERGRQIGNWMTGKSGDPAFCSPLRISILCSHFTWFEWSVFVTWNSSAYAFFFSRYFNGDPTSFIFVVSIRAEQHKQMHKLFYGLVNTCSDISARLHKTKRCRERSAERERERKKESQTVKEKQIIAGFHRLPYLEIARLASYSCGDSFRGLPPKRMAFCSPDCRRVVDLRTPRWS